MHNRSLEDSSIMMTIRSEKLTKKEDPRKRSQKEEKILTESF